MHNHVLQGRRTTWGDRGKERWLGTNLMMFHMAVVHVFRSFRFLYHFHKHQHEKIMGGCDQHNLSRIDLRVSDIVVILWWFQSLNLKGMPRRLTYANVQGCHQFSYLISFPVQPQKWSKLHQDIKIFHKSTYVNITSILDYLTFFISKYLKTHYS